MFEIVGSRRRSADGQRLGCYFDVTASRCLFLFVGKKNVRSRGNIFADKRIERKLKAKIVPLV